MSGFSCSRSTFFHATCFDFAGVLISFLRTVLRIVVQVQARQAERLYFREGAFGDEFGQRRGYRRPCRARRQPEGLFCADRIVERKASDPNMIFSGYSEIHCLRMFFNSEG